MVYYDRTTENYVQKLEAIKSKPSGGGRHLNLGCGPMVLQGWFNIDKYHKAEGVITADINDLPFEYHGVDTIFSSHSLEHQPFHHARKSLKHWFKYLSHGGRLCLAVPDLENQMKIMLDPSVSYELKWGWYIYTIFGYQVDTNVPMNMRHDDMPVEPGQIHYCGFTREWLSRYLSEVGYSVQEMWTYDGWGTPSIYVEAIKP